MYDFFEPFWNMEEEVEEKARQLNWSHVNKTGKVVVKKDFIQIKPVV